MLKIISAFNVISPLQNAVRRSVRKMSEISPAVTPALLPTEKPPTENSADSENCMTLDEKSTENSLKRLADDSVSSDNSVADSKVPRLEPQKERIKRKKYALLISYSGMGYLGLQRNPGMKTIEEDILTALLKAGLITEEAFVQPQMIQFQRAARTDKGVSAVRQVLSIKLPEEVHLEAVNSHLPDQIRAVGVKRTTKGFNCKANCDSRTYSYMMPSFALAPHDIQLSEEYRIPREVLDKTNGVLKHLLGTHNYHNFTSRRKPMDPSAQRYIMSFQCEEPIETEGMEFVILKVKGQSFMLHQIRKMVGLVIAIVRGLTSVETISKAWEVERLDLPVAPGLGLVLEEVHYDRYNQRYGKDGIHEPIEWSAHESFLEEFRKKFILSTILKTEKEEKSMLTWLESLPNHSYDVRNGDRTKDAEEEEEDEDEISINGNMKDKKLQ